MDLKDFCKENGVDPEKLGDIGEMSDGYHTFNSLYHQRLILFATLVNAFPSRSWKSRRHSDGEPPFGGGWFIVGIETPEGPYTYHYEDKDWDLFHCEVLEKAPEWDGHTDKDVERLLSLTETKPNTQMGWAEKEVTLAIQAEKDGAESMTDWKYGAECFKSALNAYESLTNDVSIGTNIGVTKSILNRLLDGKVLTPIEDTPDIWVDVTGEFAWKDGTQHYQCSRMSSLFKKVAPDGTVTYSDVNRVVAVDVDKPDVAWQNSSATQLVDLFYPITLPYLPTSAKFKVFREEFLTDTKSKGYDTVAFLYIIQPDGKKVELNRYFKVADGEMVRIEKDEFEERKARRVEK